MSGTGEKGGSKQNTEDHQYKEEFELDFEN